MSLIKIEHLWKEYPNVTPLKDINTEINAGDIISIIGPSGSGRSTLLKCLNLSEKPTRGKIYFNGTDIGSPKFSAEFMKRKIGMVFQSFNLFPNLSIIENIISAPVNILKIPRQEAYDEGIALLEQVGLSDKALLYPADLSVGQKQCVAIVRAIAMKPDVLLFDELTSSLDTNMVNHVRQLIRKLAAEGRTMIISTHEIRFAREISNRIFYMDNGEIYEEGTPEQIFENPQGEKTRNFILNLKHLNLEIKNSDYDFFSFTSTLDRFSRDYMLPHKQVRNIQLAFEEIISQNLVPYSEVYYNEYPIKFTVEYSETDGSVGINISYSGMEYNPIEGSIDLSAVIVKQLSEYVNYRYENDTNYIDILLKKPDNA